MTDEKKTVAIDEDEYKTLIAKSTSQATKIGQLEAQLKDATDTLVIITGKLNAAEKEEKDAVIDELIRNSQGKLTKETLQEHDLKELYFLKDTLDKAEPRTFVSVMRQREKDAQEQKPQGTVGHFNPETKTWEGGV